MTKLGFNLKLINMDIQGKIHCLAVKFQMKMVKLKVYLVYNLQMISCLFTFDLFTIIGTYTIPDANGDPILVRYKAGPKTGYVVDNLDEVLERTNPQGSSGEILFEMTHQEIFFNIFFLFFNRVHC